MSSAREHDLQFLLFKAKSHYNVVQSTDFVLNSFRRRVKFIYIVKCLEYLLWPTIEQIEVTKLDSNSLTRLANELICA